jgi:ribonuclease-3
VTTARSEGDVDADDVDRARAPVVGADLDDLIGSLRIAFDDPDLLRRALVHRSWAFEHDDASNERLEFLGDAVLDVVVTDELFHLRPDQPEGRLAELRAAAVSESSLAAVARDIGLGEHLKLGVGEADSGGADKDSLLSDGLEAVLGAVYLDQGFVVAYDVTQRLFAGRLGELLAKRSVVDPKTALQEHLEATVHELPRYAVRGSGPDHERTFHATVRVADEVIGSGSGSTKKAAERAAALEAMRDLTDEPERDVALAAPVPLAGSRGLGSR